MTISPVLPPANDDVDAGAEVVAFKPCCGNCRFAMPLKGDFLRVECRWGPPHSSMVPMPGPGPSAAMIGGSKMQLQQISSFPQLPKNFFCFRHEQKPTNGGG